MAENVVPVIAQLEEYVYNMLKFIYGWYFTFVQGSVYLTLISLQGFTTKQMVNPGKMYVKLSVVLMGSHGLTKGSLAYLNYPAQLMFKSTKVLPVMIMGAFIPGLRRKYPPREYFFVVHLVVGLFLFTLADVNSSLNFSIIGVVMDEAVGFAYEEAYFTLQDLKGIKLSGSTFNILFNLNKFMTFESRDRFLIRQERENPTLTEWDWFAHREYIRLSMEEDADDASNGSGDVWDESLEAPF
ncbi:unnamed protein product [Lactuca virosa]|uniref:Uncharacterized protein n=1 Tax=Lactuca virosa TaxID=75947 RepID=A0AAU9M064_9ASTR|nr:unnamed protein product [Lactuca virosa]